MGRNMRGCHGLPCGMRCKVCDLLFFLDGFGSRMSGQ